MVCKGIEGIDSSMTSHQVSKVGIYDTLGRGTNMNLNAWLNLNVTASVSRSTIKIKIFSMMEPKSDQDELK